ncbi:MAG: type II toxin-antitoxin system RelE/ParE family toxin [Acidobacteriota bacterium]
MGCRSPAERCRHGRASGVRPRRRRCLSRSFLQAQVTRRVSFHGMAERELDEAASYYSAESPGLGVTFLDEIRRCIQSILEHPEAGPVLVGSVRRRLARRFPYAVVYSIRPAEIRVLAVMHLRRRPMYWLGRE